MIIRLSTIYQIATIAVLVIGSSIVSSKTTFAQEAVIVVGSPAAEVVTNTLKNTANLLVNTLSAKNIEALILKEFNLDSLARNQAQKLQQQLVSDTIKMLGGQLPGQNGEIPFIQDYAKHYADLSDAAAARIIFGDTLVDQCSEQKTYETRAEVYKWYIEEVRGQSAAGAASGAGPVQNQCQETGSGEAPGSGPGGGARRSLDQILYAYSSGNDGIAKSLKGKNDLAVEIADKIDISKTENVNGFFPTKTCKDIATGDNPAGPTGNSSGFGGATATKPDCKIVTPASLISDSVSYNVGQLPAELLLNVDEFNEIVSNFMSNLTNQAISGATGVLGLSGNSDYGSNVFGPSGDRSYAEALAEDDISKYQTELKNPIKDAIKTETKYKELQNKILSEIVKLEAKLATTSEAFPGCFELELTAELTQAKADALSNLEISSTTSAILKLLDTQFDAATEPAVKNAVVSTFIEYQSQGYFRTEPENQDLELSYINYQFAEMVDLFKYDTAVAKSECGGEFDYTGVLSEPEDSDNAGGGNN